MAGSAGTPEARGRVRRWWAMQVSDPEMARRLGCSTRHVGKVRERLGLPSWYSRGRLNAAQRAGRRAALERSLAARGLTTLLQLRPEGAQTRKRKELAGRYGLPAELYLTQTRTLLALARGPARASELAVKLGLRPGGYKSFNSEAGKGLVRGGNYLTDLCARGLVARVPVNRGKGNRSGRGESVYMLTPLAMELLTKGGAA